MKIVKEAKPIKATKYSLTLTLPAIWVKSARVDENTKLSIEIMHNGSLSIKKAEVQPNETA